MQTFYEGWRIVQAFIDSDALMPREVALPRPAHREVARILVERRDYPVIDVVEAIASLPHPGPAARHWLSAGGRAMALLRLTDTELELLAGTGHSPSQNQP